MSSKRVSYPTNGIRASRSGTVSEPATGDYIKGALKKGEFLEIELMKSELRKAQSKVAVVDATEEDEYQML